MNVYEIYLGFINSKHNMYERIGIFLRNLSSQAAKDQRRPWLRHTKDLWLPTGGNTPCASLRDARPALVYKDIPWPKEPPTWTKELCAEGLA